MATPAGVMWREAGWHPTLRIITCQTKTMRENLRGLLRFMVMNASRMEAIARRTSLLGDGARRMAAGEACRSETDQSQSRRLRLRWWRWVLRNQNARVKAASAQMQSGTGKWVPWPKERRKSSVV